jgi:uncharacterized membrane protein (DUF106 family)
MVDLWLKIRMWTKAVLLVLLFVYAILFAVNNRFMIDLWVFPFVIPPRIPVALVVLIAAVLGVLGTLLVRAALRTMSQMREVKRRESERDKERDAARWREQQEKAARLKTRENEEPGV